MSSLQSGPNMMRRITDAKKAEKKDDEPFYKIRGEEKIESNQPV